MKKMKQHEKTQVIVLNAVARQVLKRCPSTQAYFDWCTDHGHDPADREALDAWADTARKSSKTVGAVLESQATIELLMSGHTRETMALGILASARAARHEAAAVGDIKGIAAMADLELRLLGMAKEAKPPSELRADDPTTDPVQMSDADLVRALAPPDEQYIITDDEGGHDAGSDGAA